MLAQGKAKYLLKLWWHTIKYCDFYFGVGNSKNQNVVNSSLAVSLRHENDSSIQLLAIPLFRPFSSVWHVFGRVVSSPQNTIRTYAMTSGAAALTSKIVINTHWRRSEAVLSK